MMRHPLYLWTAASLLRKLGEGLEHNCGPPYVLTP